MKIPQLRKKLEVNLATILVGKIITVGSTKKIFLKSLKMEANFSLKSEII